MEHPFCEALSGKFRPPTDLENRQHSLVRLANGTFVKGTQEGPAIDDEYGKQIRYAYRPGWAPKVESIIICHALNEKAMALSGIALILGDDAAILDVNFVRPYTDYDINISTYDATKCLMTSTGDEIDAAQAEVTHEAQHFFDQAIYIG